MRLLCFGDSNTWGSAPFVLPNGTKRWPEAARWTTRLAAKLGPSWDVCVDGLSGRTTDLDDPDEGGGKSGLEVMSKRLDADAAFDAIIIMLGTNDLKIKFQRDASAIADGMSRIVTTAVAKNNAKILIVAPPPLSAPAKENPMFSKSVTTSKEIAPCFADLAARLWCHFCDAAEAVPCMGGDGVHMEFEAQERLAELLLDRLQKIHN